MKSLASKLSSAALAFSFLILCACGAVPSRSDSTPQSISNGDYSLSFVPVTSDGKSGFTLEACSRNWISGVIIKPRDCFYPLLAGGTGAAPLVLKSVPTPASLQSNTCRSLARVILGGTAEVGMNLLSNATGFLAVCGLGVILAVPSLGMSLVLSAKTLAEPGFFNSLVSYDPESAVNRGRGELFTSRNARALLAKGDSSINFKGQDFINVIATLARQFNCRYAMTKDSLKDL